MEYIIDFELVDNDTGEVLTKSKRCSYNTQVPDSKLTLTNWLACFYRGLDLGHNLTLQLSANQFQIPVQKELF